MHLCVCVCVLTTSTMHRLLAPIHCLALGSCRPSLPVPASPQRGHGWCHDDTMLPSPWQSIWQIIRKRWRSGHNKSRMQVYSVRLARFSRPLVVCHSRRQQKSVVRAQLTIPHLVNISWHFRGLRWTLLGHTSCCMSGRKGHSADCEVSPL